MTEETLLKKLELYYNKIKNPTYIIGNWIIVNDDLYHKYKNKINISSINSILHSEDYDIIVFETKKQYYAVKYSSNFVCIRESDNEYNLITDDYDLLGINKKIIHINQEETNNNITIIDLAKDLGWKLGKKAKKDFEQFD
jgi:hypothetical protein